MTTCSRIPRGCFYNIVDSPSLANTFLAEIFPPLDLRDALIPLAGAFLTLVNTFLAESLRPLDLFGDLLPLRLVLSSL